MAQTRFVDHYLAYLLARASHRISSEFHDIVDAQGVSLLEWRVMAGLSGVAQLRIGELADVVLAKQPTVTKLVGRMQEAGWVQRIDAAHDKRQSLVSLTAAGRRKVQPLLRQAKAHEQAVLAQFDGLASAQLKQVLRRLILGDHPSKAPPGQEVFASAPKPLARQRQGGPKRHH